MTFEKINQLVENEINIIFNNLDISQMSNYEKELIIYNHLIQTKEYDYDLLEKRKRRGPVNLLQEVFDVFEKQIGICSSLSHVYKLLLEKLGIEAKTVICNDGNPVFHQLIIIKNNIDNKWYFSDVTRGIIYKVEKLDNFLYGYDRCKYINQEMMGILPDTLYDAVFKRNVDREDENMLKLNENNLFDLPENIYEREKVR